MVSPSPLPRSGSRVKNERGPALMPFEEFNALVGLDSRYAEDERYRA